IPTPAPAPAPSPSYVNVPTSSPPAATQADEKSRTSLAIILSAAIGGSVLLLLSIAAILCYRSGRVAAVKPWRTGLSGHLQRALVAGVPKLRRSELEAACEDFSNVIGSLSVCTLYKGTLSSGVEIAVASIDTASSAEWSSSVESQFRTKIDTLSKVNHKNFVSLIGYCEEDEPFTRMMVFEYAPNGTLFEHLHIKEAEHLDWAARLRVVMGIAYCLDHMHRMTPPLSHRNLTSSSIYLTEDYAAKVSDVIFWDKGPAVERPSTPPTDVYSFGVLLFEIITGKLPYSSGDDWLEDWAFDYLRSVQSLTEVVDPTLGTYRDDQLQQLKGVTESCTNPDPRQRPSMADVCTRLRMITGIGTDSAVPKSSPLWWAEVEIQSTEAG
ncbi:probable inactive receptor-like protein kinase At3g56050, partial [Andrographis paniculata]|uniref:probable inactive receptor-like protein kinase At3g56050 n=1 Tax=Andrographis paniculata TaxID=175694 RepID=UPI0021E9511F